MAKPFDSSRDCQNHEWYIGPINTQLVTCSIDVTCVKTQSFPHSVQYQEHANVYLNGLEHATLEDHVSLIIARHSMVHRKRYIVCNRTRILSIPSKNAGRNH